MSFITKIGVLGQKAMFKLKMASPQIRTAAGVIGFFGAAVLIIKETRKVDPILEEHKQKIEEVSDKKEKGEIDKKEAGKAYFVIWTGTVRDLAKLYWPAAAVMGASTLSVVSGMSDVTKNLADTTAALAVMHGKFNKAEERTVDRYGREVADELFYGIKKEITTSKEIDPETGEEKTIAEEHIVVDKDALPLITDFFMQGCNEFQDGNSAYNYWFLGEMQKWIQGRCDAGYFVTYNEIRDYYGTKRLKDEFGMDWGYGPGDIVDLGLDDCQTEADRRFVNGIEDVFLMRFKGMHPLRSDLQKAYHYNYKKV